MDISLPSGLNEHAGPDLLGAERGAALGALDQVEAAWDALPTRSPMDQYIWSRACAEAFGTGRRLQIVTAGDEARPAAVAPLFVPEDAPARLEGLGVAVLGEPADLAHEDPRALDELCRALARRRLPVILARVPAGSPTVPAMQRAYRGRGAVICRPVKSYPSIPLDPSWREPERHLSPRRRSDLRRAQRRAEALGEVRFEVRSPSPAELTPLLEEAFSVEEASWKGRAGTALSLDEMRGRFFRRYAAAAAAKGILRLCFLRIGGRAAAMQIAIEHASRIWLLKIGYDEELGRCSPGVLLLLESVRHAAGSGLEGYEFLGGVAPWTKVWTQVERPCVAIHAYPLSTQGLWQLASAGARFAVKQLRGAV